MNAINNGHTAVDLSPYALTTSGQPVDLEAAKEFMEATLSKIARVELGEIEAELQEKGQRLRALLAPDVVFTLSEKQLYQIFRSVFATRRRAKTILKGIGVEQSKSAISNLLYGSGTVDVRFQEFVDVMSGYIGDIRILRPRKSSDSRAKLNAEKTALEENVFCDLGSELLHFTKPLEYWLWTRWIWMPQSGTGAMPLVTMEEVDLYGFSVGETYLKVGVATAFVKATSEAAQLADFGTGPYSVDVFLACVYAVYMYTTLRLRMTQEFNKVVPQLPQLIRRLLGVWQMEI
jgi:hypothetical protein